MIGETRYFVFGGSVNDVPTEKVIQGEVATEDTPPWLYVDIAQYEGMDQYEEMRDNSRRRQGMDSRYVLQCDSVLFSTRKEAESAI